MPRPVHLRAPAGSNDLLKWDPQCADLTLSWLAELLRTTKKAVALRQRGRAHVLPDKFSRDVRSVIESGKLKQSNLEANDVEYAVSLYCYFTRQPLYIQMPVGGRRYRVILRWFGSVKLLELWADAELARQKTVYEKKWGNLKPADGGYNSLASTYLSGNKAADSLQFKRNEKLGPAWRRLEIDAFREVYERGIDRGQHLPKLGPLQRFNLQWRGVELAPRLWGRQLVIDGVDERRLAGDVQQAVAHAFMVRQTHQNY